MLNAPMMSLTLLLAIATLLPRTHSQPNDPQQPQPQPQHPKIIAPWRTAPDARNVQRNPRAYAPRPESAMSKSWDGRVHVDCVDPSMVALTFDDGVNEGTERVLDFLRRNQVKATFFVLGSQVDSRVLRRIIKDGHVIGSHSWDHPSFPQLSDWDMRWQLQSTEDQIYKACRRRPRLFRPPYGDVDWRVSMVVTGEGYEIVNWNIDSNDWHGDPWAAQSAITGGLGGGWKDGGVSGWKRVSMDGGDGKRRRPGHQRGGYIILQHDAYFQDFVGEAAIKTARRRGLRFVTLAECLGVHAYKNQGEVDRESAPPVATTSASTRRTSTSRSTGKTSTKRTFTTHSHHHHNTSASKAFEEITNFTVPPTVPISTHIPTTAHPTVFQIPAPVPLATLVIAVPLNTSTPPAAQPTYEPVLPPRHSGRFRRP